MFSEKTVVILKIRAKILDAARSWFKQNNYIEVNGPTMIPAVGNWPSSFEVKYFDKKGYLAQGLQPYANAFVANLGKVYTIAPTFRAEKMRTRRHLAEYWRIEVAQQCELNAIIKIQEELVEHICHSFLKEDTKELKCFNRFVEDLAGVQTPFPRVTYDEAIDVLQKDGLNISWGQKIDWEMENHLSRKFSHPFFVTEFPIGTETFFLKSDPEKPELTLSSDMLAPEGYGEICGGGQMIDEKRVLLQKMAEEKIEQGIKDWYLDLVQIDSVPRSGFVLGLERTIMWICKLENIKSAAAFPRTFNSIYP